MGIYVETVIRGDIDDLWQKTQTPDLHERWDLRFSQIRYLPRANATEPQRFLYSTRIGFGFAIRGEGETVGDHLEGDRRASALRFWSDDRKSLIVEGSGYWSYQQQERGVRFLTWYDYRTRFGLVGRIVDKLLFRPLIGWATAWSFDRLRLWIERGIDPASALRNSLIHGVARVTLAFIWLYHGYVPKLLLAQRDEVAMLVDAGVSPGTAHALVPLIGLGEIAFGALTLLAWRSRWLFPVTIAAMLLLTGAVALLSPRYLGGAFNPVTLNAAVLALALIGFIASGASPFAGRCLRKRQRGAS